MSEKLINFIRNPGLLFLTLGHRSFFNWIDDKTYLKIAYRIKTGKRLNLDDPQTFNEKIQWLKIYDRKAVYSRMVDKYEAKKVVAEKIGEKYVIPTLGVWDKFDDINFSELPDKFVLKCTHDSGGLIIVKDKSKLDINKAKRKINRSLRHNYYWGQREWVYKNIRPRIIAEKYLEESNVNQIASKTLIVYKIFNFAGKPELIQVIQNDKTTDETIDYFDVNWNLLDLRQNYPNSAIHLKKPQNLAHMLELACVLSKGHKFVRTDFYSIDGMIFFSEFTFYSDSGFELYHPEYWDNRLGELIQLGVESMAENDRELCKL